MPRRRRHVAFCVWCGLPLIWCDTRGGPDGRHHVVCWNRREALAAIEFPVRVPIQVPKVGSCCCCMLDGRIMRVGASGRASGTPLQVAKLAAQCCCCISDGPIMRGVLGRASGTPVRYYVTVQAPAQQRFAISRRRASAREGSVAAPRIPQYFPCLAPPGRPQLAPGVLDALLAKAKEGPPPYPPPEPRRHLQRTLLPFDDLV